MTVLPYVSRVSRPLYLRFPRPASTPDDPRPLLDPDEFRIFATAHSNCLLIGPDALVEKALTALQPAFRHAPVFLDGRQLLEWPASSRAATFVVRDVGELSASQQQALSFRIEAMPDRLQVVSTAAAPIWPAVKARLFLRTLYYRLNTLTIPLAPSS